ncbi:MAG: STAS domain-containing protein [Thermoleophilia bacterium]
MAHRAAQRPWHVEEVDVGGATLRLTWPRTPRTAPPILSLEGEYDSRNVPEIDRFLKRQLGPLYHQNDLVFDLSATTFVDSAFVGFVVAVAGDQRPSRTELVLVRPQGQVRRTLAIVGLPNLVPVYETLDEAVMALVYGRTPLIPPAFNAISA